MNTPNRHLLAFLDESQSHHDLDPHTYILAAGVCAPAEADESRPVLSALRARGQVKLHWRDESDKRRRQVTEAIARLPLRHLVVVRDGMPGESPERRRRHCLEAILYELDRLAVGMATFESRGPADEGSP